MFEDVLEMIGMYILATAEEKIGNNDKAKELWDILASAEFDFKDDIEARCGGIFEN